MNHNLVIKRSILKDIIKEHHENARVSDESIQAFNDLVLVASKKAIKRMTLNNRQTLLARDV